MSIKVSPTVEPTTKSTSLHSTISNSRMENSLSDQHLREKVKFKIKIFDTLFYNVGPIFQVCQNLQKISDVAKTCRCLLRDVCSL